MKHYPMTQDQRQTLDRDVATIMENLGGIVTLLRACHGDKDEQVYRAEEARAAVQRLSLGTGAPRTNRGARERGLMVRRGK